MPILPVGLVAPGKAVSHVRLETIDPPVRIEAMLDLELRV